MARPRSVATDIRPLVENFAAQVVALVERKAQEGARAAVLRALGVSAAPAPARRGPGRPRGSAAPRPARARARRKPVSASQRSARQLQGRYIGSLRGLTKGDQAKVKAMRAKNGSEAAIKLGAALKAKASA